MATVQDAYGNPKPGDTVTFRASGGASIGPVTDNGNGTYSATVTASTNPGSEIITATDGSVSGQATLTETAVPTITSVSPAALGQGANGGPYAQSVNIVGSEFENGATASFGPGITVSFTTVVDSAHMTAHVIVAGNATVGSRNVTVTNPDTTSATCSGCFTVDLGPTVTSLVPSAFGPGTTGTITVTGSNFASGIKVGFSGGDVATTSVSVVSSSQLSVGVSVSSTAIAGTRNLTVTNATDQGSFTCSGCFTVDAPPAPTSVTPNAAGPGASTTVTVVGSGFVSGAKVSFSGTGVGVNSVSFTDSGHLSVAISVASSAAPGTLNVTVTNPDGGKGTCSGCFTVDPAPTVTSAAPASMAPGASATVTISGSNFAPGATVSISAGVGVSNVKVVSSSSITATVTVPSGAAAGARTVTVTNPDGGRGSSACFTVT